MTHTNRLKEIFLQVFELPEGTPMTTLKYRSTKSWDSVGHMRLVAAIETEFGIFMETEQILDMSDFQMALGILKAHGITD